MGSRGLLLCKVPLTGGGRTGYLGSDLADCSEALEAGDPDTQPFARVLLFIPFSRVMAFPARGADDGGVCLLRTRAVGAHS